MQGILRKAAADIFLRKRKSKMMQGYYCRLLLMAKKALIDSDDV